MLVSTSEPVPPIAPTAPPDAASSGSSLSDLLAILEAQTTVYGQLLHVAEARHAALAAADADQLQEIAEHEQPLLSRVRRLETARLQVIRPWAVQLGIAPEQLTVSALCEQLDPASAGVLAAARDRLLATVATVDQASTRNARLLERCLTSVNDSVRHLLETVQLDPRYAQTGTRSDSENAPRLTDYRA